ncbi:MAG TPA: hypothetical protein VM616_06325 [Gammaproteobacteria bacterium]|nr:hypothetical protein [Gammaproteobacteria bacterium]
MPKKNFDQHLKEMRKRGVNTGPHKKATPRGKGGRFVKGKR